MSAWSDRPLVEAAYYNPALVGLVIHEMAKAYEQERLEPMDWMLVYIGVPVSFHKSSRLSVPDKRTHLSSWLQRNPYVVADFPRRMADMAPHAREGFRFALLHGAIELDRGHVRATGTVKPPKSLTDFGKAGDRVGRILSKTRETSTVFTMFGVRV